MAIDPAEVLDQAAALAAHLQRSGVVFMPAPDEEQVETIKPQLTPVIAEPRLASKVAPVSTPPVTAANSATASPVAAQSVVAPARPAAPRATTKAKPVRASQETYQSDALPAAERAGALEVIQQEVAACTVCEVLSSCRKNTVFGEGNPAARIVFMGEGPGADEDRTGRPFVGASGNLLTKMIVACRLQREETYILNTVKCRPPGNRNPEPEEIENCRPFYQRQLEILQPEYIVCLGRIAAHELLQTKLSIGRMRGQWHAYATSKVLVTYHPSYLLRNPDAKKAAWEDLQMMMADAGL